MHGIINEQLTLTAREIAFYANNKEERVYNSPSNYSGSGVYLQSWQYPWDDTTLKSRVLTKNWAQMKLTSFQQAQVMSV